MPELEVSVVDGVLVWLFILDYCSVYSKSSMFLIFISTSDCFFYSFIFPERASLQLHKGEMTSTENSIIIYSRHPSCHSRKHCCPSSMWVSQIMCEPSWRYICPQIAVTAQSNKTFTTPTCHNKIFNWLLKKNRTRCQHVSTRGRLGVQRIPSKEVNLPLN